MPLSLHLWVQLNKQLGAAACSRLSETVLIEKEVDAQVGFLDGGVVEDGEPADPRKDQILERFDADRSAPRVDEENVGRFQSCLAAGRPQA